jgi:hypothetical protein
LQQKQVSTKQQPQPLSQQPPQMPEQVEVRWSAERLGRREVMRTRVLMQMTEWQVYAP